MTLLAGLSLAGLIGLHTLQNIWSQETPNTATIELPPDLPDTDAQTHAIIELLDHTQGVTRVHQFSPEETQALLAPWLDSSSANPNTQLPVSSLPRIITAEHIPQLVLAPMIAAHFPSAVLEENSHWAERLTTLIATLTYCAELILAITLGTTSLTTAIVIRRAVTTQRHNLTILHGLGSAPLTLANRMAVHSAVLGFLGSLVGLFLLAPLMVTLAHSLKPVLLSAPDTLSYGPAFLSTTEYANLFSPQFWPIFALPLFCSVIAWTTTQCVILTWLRRLP
ncbi:cell division protein FtsX [Neokomagataea thailandica NBRC 106555]|nr:cell division protein FtsX [Neokomagataea thailandica NBRC 106555]